MQLKLKHAADAHQSVEHALGVEGTGGTERAKALFRGGCALAQMKNDEDAIKMFEKAKGLAPGDANIENELAAAKKRESTKIQKEKAAFKKFFS
jgi:peptidyl-prolyl isomerase D